MPRKKTATYQFQPGTLPHRAYLHMKASLQPGQQIANAALADDLDVDGAALNTALKYAEERSGLVKSAYKGRLVFWQLGDGKQPAKPHDYTEDEPLHARPKRKSRAQKKSPAMTQEAPAPAPEKTDKCEPKPVPIKEPRYSFDNNGCLSISANGRDVELSQEQTANLLKFVDRIFK